MTKFVTSFLLTFSGNLFSAHLSVFLLASFRSQGLCSLACFPVLLLRMPYSDRCSIANTNISQLLQTASSYSKYFLRASVDFPVSLFCPGEFWHRYGAYPSASLPLPAKRPALCIGSAICLFIILFHICEACGYKTKGVC